METYLFYGPLVLGLIALYLGLRTVFGSRDEAWARYSESAQRRGRQPERTPEWECKQRRVGMVIALVGGFLLSIALSTYLLFF